MADPTLDITASANRPGPLPAASSGIAVAGPRAREVAAPGKRAIPVGKMVWRRAFTGVAEEAPQARAFVRCLLAGSRWADDAEFATAELVNNALLHTRSGRPGGYFVVEVTRRPRSLRVGVYDLGGGGVPELEGEVAGSKGGPGVLPGSVSGDQPNDSPRGFAGWSAEGDPADPLEEALREHGRGLGAVTRLASRTGCRGNAVTGHFVWALFDKLPPEHRWPT